MNIMFDISVIYVSFSRHAGVIFGINNTFATVSGMVAPLIVAALTPNVSRKLTGMVTINPLRKISVYR